MRKRVYSCSTVDFEFLHKTRALSESFATNNAIPVASSPAHHSNSNHFVRKQSLTSDNGDEIMASSMRNSMINDNEHFKSFRHNSIIGADSFANTLQNTSNTSNYVKNVGVSKTKDQRALSFSFNPNSSISNDNGGSNGLIAQVNSNFNQNNFKKHEILSHPNTFPCLSPSCVVLSPEKNEGKLVI